MKSVILILILLLASCPQFNNQNVGTKATPIQQANQESKDEASAIDEVFKNKPQWLFPADICPVDVMPIADKEIKYLSEGCADNPEACLKKCRDDDDGNACYSLALYLQESRGLKNEISEPLYLRSCKLGIISGCTNKAAGIYDLDSKELKPNKCAADTFEKTCARDDTWGCTMFGLVLSSGIGREKNIEEAKKAFKKACRKLGEDDPACQNARTLEVKFKISQ